MTKNIDNPDLGLHCSPVPQQLIYRPEHNYRLCREIVYQELKWLAGQTQQLKSSYYAPEYGPTDVGGVGVTYLDFKDTWTP